MSWVGSFLRGRTQSMGKMVGEKGKEGRMRKELMRIRYWL